MTAGRATRRRWQEHLLAAAAGALAVVMFLDWFKASAGVGNFSRQDGSLQFALDDGRRSAWQAFTVVDLVLVAIRIATPPSLGLAPNVAVTATVWAWIGLLVCCSLAAGGALVLLRAGEPEGPAPAADYADPA